MGKCILLKSGSGGIDPDELTATKEDILINKLAGVKGNDEPVSGLMPNRGAVTQSLNCGNSYTIPSGYHNGSGKVTANSLSSQTSANATSGQILSGQTAWVNGSKITGSMPNRGAVSQGLGINGSYTIPAGYHNGNGKVTQSIPVQGGSTTTPGTTNKTIVAANRYVNGNIIVAGSSNLTAGNIKKGVNIFGIIGTWEGWVAAATDLYKNGVNSASFTTDHSSITFESGSIKYTSNLIGFIKANKNYNLSGYSNLNIEFLITAHGESYISFILRLNGTLAARTSIVAENGKRKTISLSIDAIQLTGLPEIDISCTSSSSGGITKTWSGYIYRIWLS